MRYKSLKNTMKNFLYTILLLAVVTTSCTKNNDDLQFDTAVKAKLSVEFDNIVGAADLQLNTGTYTNAAGESFKVNKLKYYISNFAVTNINGTVYTVPADSSYYLIDESTVTSHRPVLNIPEGEYKTLSFIIGVDSLRNTMDISKRTGVLDPTTTAADMYWGWNSGYIFYKLEGTAASAATGNFMYHVGGFGGYSTATVNNLRTITIDLTARGTAKVKAGKTSNIHLFADVLKTLNGTTNMSFASVSMIHAPLGAVSLANNYISMFTHDHTEN